jgi:hypothetical protein
MLSDTSDALEEKGRSLIESTSDRSTIEHSKQHRPCSIVTTIEKSAYSLLHQTVIRYLDHWVDFVSMLRPLQSEESVYPNSTAINCSEWELVYQSAATMKMLPDASRNSTEQEISLKFRVKILENKSGDDYYEPLHEISWKE